MKKKPKTNAQRRAAKARRKITIKIRDPRLCQPFHEQLRPDVVDALHRIWNVIGDIHPTVPTFEYFEFIHSKNRDQVDEFLFLGFVCARVEQYRAEHPQASASELRGMWEEIGTEFSKIAPYFILQDVDGTQTLCIRDGFEEPSQATVFEARKQASGWLLANDIHLLCEGILDIEVARGDTMFLDAIKRADVIVGEDINGLGSSVFYGRELVERAKSNGSETGSVMTVAIDGATDDVEKLYAIVKVVRGRCDYGRAA